MLAAGAAGCQGPGTLTVPFPAPSADERYCAWYGDARGTTLYFGQAPFWWAMGASGGEPLADLKTVGPQWIGRFDLASLSASPSIDVTRARAHAGIWDVLPHDNSWVYFTTFYELAGAVQPATAAVRHFEQLGTGLNELAPGPEGTILATRYGGGQDDPGGNGSLVLFSPDGLLFAEYPLMAPDGFTIAPKTPAWDEHASRYWVTTDLIPRDPSAPEPNTYHPTLVLDDSGAEIARLHEVEVQFVRFSPDGRGVAAFVSGSSLRLATLGPGSPTARVHPGAGLELDAQFPGALDFVQDISFGPNDETVVTRWGGLIHVIGADGSTQTVQLPRNDPRALYYSGVLTPDGRTVCATRCRDVAVVCRALP